MIKFAGVYILAFSGCLGICIKKNCPNYLIYRSCVLYEKKIFCFKRRRYVLFCLFCFDIFFTKMCQCFFSAFVFMNCAKLQREKGVSVSQIGKWKWDAVSLDWTVRRPWIVENHNKIMGYYFLKLNDSRGWLVENY